MRAVLGRLGQAVGTLFGAGVLIFGMLALTPGDENRLAGYADRALRMSNGSLNSTRIG